LLQGQIGDAGVTVARFLVNTTAGVGGLVDVASTHGLTYKQEDFGQTLAVWGMGDGFYLVLPIIGPSSLRDAGGLAVDTYADPVRLWAHNTDNEWVYYTRVMVDGLDTRARLVSAVQDLRRNSLDYYAVAHIRKSGALSSAMRIRILR
jgi:phospholipid-binding lipoprotein MlaA